MPRMKPMPYKPRKSTPMPHRPLSKSTTGNLFAKARAMGAKAGDIGQALSACKVPKKSWPGIFRQIGIKKGLSGMNLESYVKSMESIYLGKSEK